MRANPSIKKVFQMTYQCEKLENFHSVSIISGFLNKINHSPNSPIFRFYFARLTDDLHKCLEDVSFGKYWDIKRVEEEIVDVKEIDTDVKRIEEEIVDVEEIDGDVKRIEEEIDRGVKRVEEGIVNIEEIDKINEEESKYGLTIQRMFDEEREDKRDTKPIQENNMKYDLSLHNMNKNNISNREQIEEYSTRPEHSVSYLNETPLNLRYEDVHFLHKFHLFFYPQKGPYVGLTIPVHLVLCSKYPISPPYIFTSLFHPAVYQSRMCLLRENWTIRCNIIEILYQIRISLEEPLFDEESFNQNVYRAYTRSLNHHSGSNCTKQQYPEQVSEFYERVKHSLTHDYFWQ